MNAAVGLHPLGAARRSTARWQPVSSQVLNIILSLLDLLRVHCFMGRSGETYGNPAATRNGHASRWSNLRQLNGFGRFERKLEPWQLQPGAYEYPRSGSTTLLTLAVGKAEVTAVTAAAVVVVAVAAMMQVAVVMVWGVVA